MREIDEEVMIISMIPAEDWWILYDWPGYNEYQEEPIVGFANYRADYADVDGQHSYTGIGPIVEDWHDGVDGLKFVVVTDNGKEEHGVMEVYKGKGNHRRESLRRLDVTKQPDRC